MDRAELWSRYSYYLCNCPEIGLALDISRMNFGADFFGRMEPAMQRAFAAMTELEKGVIANPDEGRMVGHYWLRNSSLAPSAELRKEIDDTVAQVTKFSHRVHSGELATPAGERFRNFLVIGIGGSALGPQFVADALSSPQDPMRPHFLDNTDPDGMDRVFAELGSDLARTLVVVISKSGSTKETRNGMLEAQAAYKKAGMEFARYAVAVTGVGSELDKVALAEGWIERFPMWDWVGGRTSVTSAVGLLPAALQGIDILALLDGAGACDEITRRPETLKNPAALMALMWHYATNGRGEKDLVVLPYKDRLLLFSRYLQQLIMESIGKELDLDGKVVCQGLSVYGNKGSTDQHAYVQQLREGVANFFVTFIEVLQDRTGASMQVEDGITSGDFLFGFFQGTRTAPPLSLRNTMFAGSVTSTRPSLFSGTEETVPPMNMTLLDPTAHALCAPRDDNASTKTMRLTIEHLLGRKESVRILGAAVGRCQRLILNECGASLSSLFPPSSAPPPWPGPNACRCSPSRAPISSAGRSTSSRTSRGSCARRSSAADWNCAAT